MYGAMSRPVHYLRSTECHNRCNQSLLSTCRRRIRRHHHRKFHRLLCRTCRSNTVRMEQGEGQVAPVAALAALAEGSMRSEGRSQSSQ